jgi:lipoyl(octanoyl) transferase
MDRALEVRRLGRVGYEEALALQRALVEERRSDRIPDQLLVLEHPPVITLGVKGDGGRSHITASADVLEALGIGVFEAGRGGDVTYHGPGQLVAYPILDLRPDRCDVHRYVRDLEEVMIRLCAAHGVAAGRAPGLTGVWVAREKIGAIGVRVSRWITSHGLAFNVAPALEHFSLIVPCGISDRGVTSLQRASGGPVDSEKVADELIDLFGDVFERRVLVSSRVPSDG